MVVVLKSEYSIIVNKKTEMRKYTCCTSSASPRRNSTGRKEGSHGKKRNFAQTRCKGGYNDTYHTMKWRKKSNEPIIETKE